MTLTEYAKLINDLIAEHPEAADLPVIYASDPEGNDAHHVVMHPSVTKAGDYSHAGIHHATVVIN